MRKEIPETRAERKERLKMQAMNRAELRRYLRLKTKGEPWKVANRQLRNQPPRRVRRNKTALANWR